MSQLQASTAQPELGAAAIVIVILIVLVVYALFAWMLGRIFAKAGEQQWKAWVPVYSSWITLEIGGLKGFYALFTFIPFVGSIIATVFQLIAQYHIGLKFGKQPIFILLAIFLPLVWLGILAFGKATWNGAPALASAPQPIDPSQPVTPAAAPLAPFGEPVAPVAQPITPVAPYPATPVAPTPEAPVAFAPAPESVVAPAPVAVAPETPAPVAFTPDPVAPVAPAPTVAPPVAPAPSDPSQTPPTV